jgi:class 3 adenylate cyclase
VGVRFFYSLLKIRDMQVSAGGKFFRIGIGVNAGDVVVGNMGSQSRAKYGIVGASVYITQRIQSIANGSEVVISESVHSYLMENELI